MEKFKFRNSCPPPKHFDPPWKFPSYATVVKMKDDIYATSRLASGVAIGVTMAGREAGGMAIAHPYCSILALKKYKFFQVI